MAEIGDILLFYLIGYILIKKNNLLKIKLKIMKQDYIAFGIWLFLLLFIINFLDNRITLNIANKYITSFFSHYPLWNKRLTIIFGAITHLGEPNFIAFGIFPIFMYAKYKRDLALENLILRMIIIIFYGVLIATSLKFIIMRSRPYQEWNNFGFYSIKGVFQKKIPFSDGYMSFPSGHTMVASCGYFFLAFTSKKKVLKMFWIILPILVALSRIYLSFHWTSDVFVSLGIGIFLANRYQKYLKI